MCLGSWPKISLITAGLKWGGCSLEAGWEDESIQSLSHGRLTDISMIIRKNPLKWIRGSGGHLDGDGDGDGESTNLVPSE